MGPNGHVYSRTLESGVGPDVVTGQPGWLVGRREGDVVGQSKDILEPSLSLITSNPDEMVWVTCKRSWCLCRRATHTTDPADREAEGRN